MNIKVLFIFFALVLFIGVNLSANTAPAEEQICGKWKSPEVNIVVQIYKADNKFKAEIVSFHPADGKPMEECTDCNNPDMSLRCRKILGMNVLEDMNYNGQTHSWEDGTIYDAQSGKKWSASAFIDKDGTLKVKGYWHFKLIGRTLTFSRL